MRKILRFKVECSSVNVIEVPKGATFLGVEGRTEASVYYMGDPNAEKRRVTVVVVPTGRYDLDGLAERGLDPDLLVFAGTLLAGNMPGAHARYEHAFLTDQPIDSGFPLFPPKPCDSDSDDCDA